MDIQVFDPLGVDLCAGIETGLLIPLGVETMFSAPIATQAIFPPVCVFDTFVKC